MTTTNNGRPLPWHDTATAKGLAGLRESGAVVGEPLGWLDLLLSVPSLQRVTTSHGYIIVRIGRGHALADRRGYVYEHRAVGAILYGGLLPSGVHVHHRDGDRAHNSPSNLEVLTPGLHYVEHRKRGDLRLPGEPNPVIPCACGCGERLAKYDDHGRPRRYLSGHNAAETVESPVRAAVLRVIGSEPITTTEIARLCGYGRDAVFSALVKMARFGMVERMSRREWRLCASCVTKDNAERQASLL